MRMQQLKKFQKHNFKGGHGWNDICATNDTRKKVSLQVIVWEKIFATFLSSKGSPVQGSPTRECWDSGRKIGQGRDQAIR